MTLRSFIILNIFHVKNVNNYNINKQGKNNKQSYEKAPEGCKTFESMFYNVLLYIYHDISLKNM
jgi:DNA replication protein DnaC